MRALDFRTIYWLLATLVVFSNEGCGFLNPSPLPRHGISWHCTTILGAASSDWLALAQATEDGFNPPPVIKRIVQPAASDSKIPRPGSTVAIAYTGSLWMDTDEKNNFGDGCGIASWNTKAVLDCWLAEQQGLFEPLAAAFVENSVDGSMLLDENVFTEDFCATTLDLSNKIQCKKTMMAARRLRATVSDFPHGKQFDSKSVDSPYKFVLGKGKTIRAMELLVGSMAVGECSEVISRCDYGYGADGFRTSQGDVLVPPFCGLSFTVTLLSAEQQ
mmetsp:Transcript_18364/g.42363  ORF Transcript_18364/g.42363 Transcript_18364/m.42363 type:complete len:274 (+) Transcript_18364:91-912(+)|eukprot:CAMPEP_0197193480 /NCGR_PEP_ID=MMETSP1423-20130617/27267_1 /TAXON_ID=476441 /ORGANISM="Pseudo-nitzschia heimii, Strain UNC1101" /LENGTH=273 /DNA_ID=CAMNT_0042646675 /DNA_START=44 /DNA_END=865 /DNA_ORIENTATION=+